MNSNLIVRIASIRLEKMSPLVAAAFSFFADFGMIQVLKRVFEPGAPISQWVSYKKGDKYSLPALALFGSLACQEIDTTQEQKFPILDEPKFYVYSALVGEILRWLININDIRTGFRSIRATLRLPEMYHTVITGLMVGWHVPLLLRVIFRAPRSVWKYLAISAAATYIGTFVYDIVNFDQKKPER